MSAENFGIGCVERYSATSASQSLSFIFVLSEAYASLEAHQWI
jgi:hypothetical protein